MPTFTLGEIASFATRRAGRRADFSLSRMSELVNTAYLFVGTEEPGALLESSATASLSSGATVALLPADFGEPISLLVVTPPNTSSQRSSYHTLARVSASVI